MRVPNVVGGVAKYLPRSSYAEIHTYNGNLGDFLRKIIGRAIVQAITYCLKNNLSLDVTIVQPLLRLQMTGS